jgi:hypothetical protein
MQYAVLGFYFGEGLYAAILRVDVQRYQAGVCEAYTYACIRVDCPPVADDVFVYRRILVAMRHQLIVRMLARLVAFF